MKYCIIILVISLQINSLCIAQEIITISEKNFNQNGGISLTSLDGWLFTQQEVPNWNEPDLDTHNWEKLNPNDLSFRYADKNGLVEGWFRLSFKVDSSLLGQDLYLNILPSGAAEMYINGELYDAAGNPNKDPRLDTASISYFARISSGWLPKPITIDSGTCVIAVYCTDHSRYLLDKHTFRSMKAGFEIGLFKKKFLLRHIKMLSEYDFYQGIWLSGILLLSFLFGILLLLNRNEKNLRWIAALSFFLACSALIEFLFSANARGIWRLDIGDLLYYESIALAVGLIPITLSQIILNRINKKLYLLWIILAVIFPILWFFYGTPVMDIVIYSLMGAALLTVAGISIKLIVSNRKKLGKAEWSVVWGLIILVLWMLIHTIFINIGFGSNAYRLMTVAMIYLTLPIALLIYISIRFSDNIFTLRKNIDEISKLNNEKLRVQEEKQKLILSQNVMLENKVSERTADLVIKNRELEIEAALERVRAIALSMKESSDMLEVCRTISYELNLLNVKEIRNVQTAIIYASKGTYLNYEFYVKHNKALITEVDFSIHHLQELFVNQMLNSTGELFTRTLKGKEVKDWYEHQKTTNQFADTYLETAKSLTYYWYSLGPVALGISTYEPLSDEEIKLFKRFRNVFELAYRRFLDIEKALAQAREVKIELALERVRARTIAMQKSDELKEVIKIVFQQLTHLKINLDHAGFVVDYKPGGDWHFWIADEQDIPSKITHPYFDSVWASQFNEAKEKGLEFFTTILNFEEKNKFYNELLSYVPGLPQASKDFYLSCPGFAATTVLMENVGLYIENFSGTPYSDEENATLIRFGKVFQQTYTRFLDLQKAETQAREAQIELSLERIRAQVTAMRESSELLDVVVTMRSEFVALGHEAHYFWHMRWLPDRYDKAMTSGDGTRIGMVMTLPRHIHGDVKFVADWEKSEEPTLVFAMDVDTAVEYVEKMISLGDFQQVDPQAPTLDDIRHIGGLTFIMARTTHGEIGFSLPGTVPNPPEESVTTLARFAGVFDLAYRRFEDLREAEEKNKIIQAENNRKTKELEEARELQISLLPKELPRLPGIEIAAYMRTATEVGGDYYDFIVQKNGVLNLALGDATGHGLQAGTMVTLMKGLFTSQSSQLGPKEFMSHCARVIKDIKLGRILMSFSYLRFENSRLLASSAGMPPIYYHHKKNNRVEEIIIQGMPLGAMRNLSYNLVEKKLCSGDTILLLTDGLPEQMNSHKVPFDYSRVRKYFSEIAENTPDDIIKSLVKKADEWMDDASQIDDITFVVIRVK